MSYKNCIFKRESYDCYTHEKDSVIYNGKLVKEDVDSNELSYAFKVEDALMRMLIKKDGDKFIINQEFQSGSSSMTIQLNKKHLYTMKLQTGHTLNFLILANDVKFSKGNISFKYQLIDKLKDEIISLNEIIIKEEN